MSVDDNKWGDWFAGTGKRPEGVADNEPVQTKNSGGRIWEARNCAWTRTLPYYRFRADHPFYGPPQWVLDEAARRCGWDDWAKAQSVCSSALQEAIRELAKEIAKNNQDPDAREREECARLLDAFGYDEFAKGFRILKSDDFGRRIVTELKTILKERRLNND